MMENPTANKSHLPCQSWVGQNGWSTTLTQGPPLNSVTSSQHLSLGLSSEQRPSYDHLQTSNQSCLSDLSTLSSTNNTHHSVLYKASHISSNLSSTTLFANTAIPSASPLISCAQQSPQTSSLLLTANQRKTIPLPSLPQPNQGLQPSRPQHVPPLSPHDPYKASFRPLLTNQGLPSRLQDLPMSLPSCGQSVSASQPTLEGANVESAGVTGYTHSYGPSTSQEQPQWISSSHCTGAVSKSVPDAAAHPNNEPSQENLTPLGSTEIWRSVLLHHRAQLLKQLAEMDKLLESIPPDDGSDGQPLPTASQFPPSMDDSSQCEQTKTSNAQQVELSPGKSRTQRHLSADCLSPATFDEHDEACDKPMSAGESEKRENTSAESGDDTDPDYIPNSDGDFSDFQSDADWGSSDESSHSCSSTSMDERAPLLLKKKAKLESSLCKDKGLKKSCATNQNQPPGAVVLPTSNSKAHRVYDKRNYCLFCSKPLAKMARHLETVHSDKAEVAVAFQYPMHSRERQKIWNKLINQGNFVHNKDVLRTGKGQLAVRKRPNTTGQAKDFLHCLYCRGLYVKKTLYRHMRLCPEKVRNENESQIGRKRIASRCALETLGDLGVSDGFKSILCEMIYDDVTQAVMDDKIILQFGEQMFNQHGSDVRKHDYIRQNLRQIARLVLEAQKITPLKNLQDFFYPSSFRHVVSAVKVLAGYDPENKTYNIPSLALKLGYHLQKACSIVESNAVKCGDASLAESARNFLSVYQKKWNELISSGALTTLRETKLTTEKTVPFAQDVKRLNFHMETAHLLAERKLRDAPSAESYAVLAKVILARTIIFNRRKPGEISTIQLTTFMSRKKSNVLDDMDVSVSDLERTMCGLFTRVDIRGNCGRMVPVLLKPSFVSAMELLVKTRETCGVPSKNPFLFGRPSALSAYKGSECIQQYVKECGAKNPEALTSRKIRKHYATMLQLLNLDEDEADQILGPNNQVRTLRQNNDMQLNDVEMVSEVRSQQAASWHHTEVSGASYEPADFYQQQAHGVTAGTEVTVPPRPVNSDNKGSQNKGKHKWEEAEVLAVERHMMRFIQGHKVPQKNDCIQCLEAEPKALRTRSWKGVKDYVRNRITALKRQSGTSSNSNRPGQVEPQQSTGHFQQL
ncbi:uncharacterized protein LOC111227338 isoform X1 [Seriola dumerili]|uniref:uncharacterized protein LOC111227338 isoform X1 n=1 Tax=Seriola dumerili TaxID=41447 RepID=UPI000BBE7910|nr:uncharacterized protein LOC111227338 isoform X1 [Seriola dumerili]XP_022608500.1 uncharacterized protein LOC111227338 isoform X1 [Seriola dumerili]